MIKKALLDSDIFKNYRTISNLTFISKVIAKVVAVRMKEHIYTHCLHDPLQSAYLELYRTEIKVQNDILCALDNGNCVILIMLDLSAAFDTVDHKILLSRLSSRFGIRGKALSWMESYLTDRLQRVNVDGVKSTERKLACGVLQGSVLGPPLFSSYTVPVGDVVRKHCLTHHVYVDYKDIYIAFKPKPDDVNRAVQITENCLTDLRTWFAQNFLQLNDDKTIFMIIVSKFNLLPEIPYIQVGEVEIIRSATATNLGVTFDEHMTSEQHVRIMTVQAFDQIRELGSIMKVLDMESTKILVHSFISFCLDYCNALLFGHPHYLLQRLQYVQNAAVRLVTQIRPCYSD